MTEHRKRAKPSALLVAGFFARRPVSYRLYRRLAQRLAKIGPVTVKVTKSQIAFVRDKPFAWAWIPDQYLHGNHAPLVLTVSFPRRDPSPRWKQIVEPAKGRFTHHLELWRVTDIDAEVAHWLDRAWEGSGVAAGPTST